ncbi:chromosome segregation protein Csm1/Pcs1-domain-containing protein [Thelonectria olida]|uniref:Chromosome segregation protein Csm1/Pcs1-domain-containing protein n=1 Tax=Thelonectria olida TaxID=1576542 RepID=A0A9P8WH99_9HYPO|nr:chromosome segregation protein Csm1/Pcs1-domain-containing protein [Thelonectria olida]
MPRGKATAPIAGLVGSDSEPDLDDFDVSEIQAARSRQSMNVTKKPRGRPLALNRVTKPTPTTGRPRGRPAMKAILETPRESLANSRISTASRNVRQARQQAQDDTIEPEEVAEPPVAASTEARKTRGRPKVVGSAVKKSVVSKGTDSVPASAIRPRGRPARMRQAATPPEEIPETQYEEPEGPQEPESMDIDVSTHDAEPSDMTTDRIENAGMYDTSDVSLRRRLGDMTKKYESLEARHRDLREVGVKEAERNFDRLRKQAEERTAAANKLIAELKKELAEQTALARQGEELQKELEGSEARVTSLENEVDTLNGSLSQAKAEAKALATKLSVFRSGEANARVPGSALKANTAASRTAQAEAAHAAQSAAQAKEDLYGDLTGLILRGLKQEETEDVFDCIQTGRNGTLHFKLAVENADQADGYDDVRFTYNPQLDPSRDEELMDMLPDYLTEEITFPRPQAANFYARVIKSLTE